MVTSNYQFTEEDHKYLMKKAHEMGMSKVDILRLALRDFRERNPLRE